MSKNQSIGGVVLPRKALGENLPLLLAALVAACVPWMCLRRSNLSLCGHMASSSPLCPLCASLSNLPLPLSCKIRVTVQAKSLLSRSLTYLHLRKSKFFPNKVTFTGSQD